MQSLPQRLFLFVVHLPGKRHSDMESDRLHVVVFPWLAFGHMIPHLELSKALARRGHRVSYIATPRNISRLPTLAGDLKALIEFVPLSLPHVDGLPEGAEATSDLAAGDVQYLKLAFDGLKTPFADFLKLSSTSSSQKHVDWIIVDFAQYWAPQIAAEVGEIPCVFFSVFIASVLAFFGPPSELGTRKEAVEFTSPPAWLSFPSNLRYSLHGARQIASSAYGDNVSGVSDGYRFLSTVQGCKVIAPRSCMEIEPDCLRLLGEIYAPWSVVVPVGLLPPSDPSVNGGRSSSLEKEIMEWLDKQSPSTVVYVAFGSEATLSVDLLKELAMGLELSGLPFLWALRKPGNLSPEEEILPERFEERNKDKGLVITRWVSQLDVLAHPSLGGFLTHSGWTSVVEALQYGHPLVLLPIFADQEINARVVDSKGFGVAIQINDEDGKFDRASVATAVRKVMAEKEGQEVRAKAKEMKGVFGNKNIHESYLDGFVAYLKNHRQARLH